MQLKNKIALITGAMGGIGKSIALHLAQEGVHLHLQYRSDLEKAQIFADELKQYNIKCSLWQADFNDKKQIANLIQNIQIQSGKLDILINCIGDFSFIPLNELKPEIFEKIINSNLQIAYKLFYFSLPLLRLSDNAHIIQLGYATACQLEAKPSILPYHIAKMGLILLCKSFAQEEAKNNILVNCLSPAIVESTNYFPVNQIPLNRTAKVSEIAESALFLLKSDYITGLNLEIDGGWRGLK